MLACILSEQLRRALFWRLAPSPICTVLWLTTAQLSIATAMPGMAGRHHPQADDIIMPLRDASQHDAADGPSVVRSAQDRVDGPGARHDGRYRTRSQGAAIVELVLRGRTQAALSGRGQHRRDHSPDVLRVIGCDGCMAPRPSLASGPPAFSISVRLGVVSVAGLHLSAAKRDRITSQSWWNGLSTG